MNSLRRLVYKPQVSSRLFNTSTKKFTITYNSKINNFNSVKVKNYFPSELLKQLAFKDFSKSFSSKVAMQQHTRIEEELHETAHIDYDRVAIQWNPSVAQLYEDALKYESGSAISSAGALVTASGIKTGRSPKDKRIVEEPSSSKDIWVSMNFTRNYPRELFFLTFCFDNLLRNAFIY
jgi:hypothetical protein